MHYCTLVSIPGYIPLEGLRSAVDTFLLPFDCNTEDPRFLQFVEENCEEEYETGKVYVVELGGILMFPWSYEIRKYFNFNREANVFTAVDENDANLVYTANNLRAQLMPFKELYSSYDEFMESFYGYEKYPNGKYGYMSNSFGAYDWYEIGGRWPDIFIVNNNLYDCLQYTPWTTDKVLISDPIIDIGDNGQQYKWVCAARKKDINFTEMGIKQMQKAQSSYKELQQIYRILSKNIDIEKCAEYKKNGFSIDLLTQTMYQYGDDVYHGSIQSLSDYMFMYWPTIGHRSKYAMNVFFGLFTSNSKDGIKYINRHNTPDTDMINAIANHIESLDENDWLVVVDIHD